MAPNQISDKDAFIRDFSAELNEGNAAVFVGAGLSVGAGYVDWRGLLKPIADELGLDVDREHDLVSLAQFHVNEAGSNRSRLTDILVDQFSRHASPTKNHELLARLPIPVYWTTNYDDLIERALRNEGRRPTIIHETGQFQLTRRGSDAVVYKMHGDAAHADGAVLVKDDYEKYYRDREEFLTALSGDLVSRTFLFLGLSFSDPNLEYVLSRIRVRLGSAARTHYAVLRQVQRNGFGSQADFDYARRRQELFVNDLRRFGIKALLIDEHSEVTELLTRLYHQHRSRTVLISGSAHEYGNWTATSAEDLVRTISARLIRRGFRVVSGFGLVIGSAAITGALEEIYRDPNRTISDSLILRPFPQGGFGPCEREEVWRNYRRDLVSLVGSAIFVFGNKLEGGEVVNASGVEDEFNLAVGARVDVIPVGATGYAAQGLWRRVMDNFDEYFPDASGLLGPFEKLGDESASADSIAAAVSDVLEELGR